MNPRSQFKFFKFSALDRDGGLIYIKFDPQSARTPAVMNSAATLGNTNNGMTKQDARL